MDSLGDQQLMRKNGEVVEANQVLKEKKVICFYFSAHWCPPCREFTPVLADFYTVIDSFILIKNIAELKFNICFNINHKAFQLTLTDM